MHKGTGLLWWLAFALLLIVKAFGHIFTLKGD